MAHVQVPAHSLDTSIPAISTLIEQKPGSALSRLTSLLPSLPPTSPSSLLIPVPITREAFAPFGQLILAYPNVASRPPNMDIQTSPDKKTNKYARLADIVKSYPEGSGAVTGISVFRATPKVGLTRGEVFDVRFMERHPYTSQAFIPMGKAEVSCI